MALLRRRRKLTIFIVIVVLCAAYVAFAFTRPIPVLTPHVNATKTQAAEAVSLPWPDYGQSAVGAVGYGVLATHGEQTPIPTASTIKILTALSVLKQYPLHSGDQGPTLTLTQADVDSYNKYVAEDGSVVRVQAGEQISEYQALQALLLPSANNMAETLARWAFGSIEAYNTFANQLAAQLGMTNTTVTDPSGFLPSTISTAHDLTLLGETAMQDPVIAEVVAEESATIPVQGAVHNVNQFLGTHSIIGIKTGNNDQDLGAFLFAATQDVSGKTVTIVGAVMDAQDLGTAMYDSLPVITAAGQNFALTTLVHAGDIVGSYSAPWSNPVDVVAQKDMSVLSWQGDALTSFVSLHHESAPLSAHKTVGAITVQNGLDKSQTTVPAVLKQALSKPSWVWRLEHAF